MPNFSKPHLTLSLRFLSAGILGGSAAHAVDSTAPPLVVPFEDIAPPAAREETGDTQPVLPDTLMESTAPEVQKPAGDAQQEGQEDNVPIPQMPWDPLEAGEENLPFFEAAPFDLQNLPGDTLPVEDTTLQLDEGAGALLEISDLAQPFGDSRLLPSIQDGFDGVAGGAYLPATETRKSSGLVVGLKGSVLYDSNVQRSSFVPDGASKDDLILSLSPFLSYGRTAGHWTSEASAQLNYNHYLMDEELSALGYTLGGRMAYDGGRWNASLGAGSSLISGGNRYLGGYSEQQSYFSSLNLSYEVGAKTRLDGGLSYNFTEPRSGAGTTTESLGTDLAGLWKYSPLLEVGPGFRYRWESSETSGDRVTLGPLLRSRYRLSRKVGLDSDLGINFFDFQNPGSGDSDPAIFARLGAHYQLSSVWAFNLSIGNDSVADEAGGYSDTFQIRGAVSRPIRRAHWNFGIGYENIERESAAAGSTSSLSVDSSLGMKVFGNRADAAVFMLWRDQQEYGGSGSWSGTQIGLSLGASF